MTLEQFVNNSIKDEDKADIDYGEMIEITKADEGLTEEEKSLIAGILFKIQTDEQTHQVLLKIIKGVLDNKKS